MKQTAWLALGTAAILTVTLSACGSASPDSSNSSSSGTEQPIGGDIVAPVTMGVNDLQGAKVELVVGQVLNIDTESLATDSYTAELSDPKVAEFHQGGKKDTADFNPGITALSAGTTTVTMVNAQGGIQPLEFTVKVVAK
ncbi:hypothetical protein QBL02_02625 [Leucobacter sp. UT-8R-CII-1-4]|uniref:hypothetical protein n=1 Tax=Leucobacter sp. UT-8R-CII-1-4 TaxID=3040075 RepID=UPI0024A92F31|nr:hypothetical protein [Leucobacter sp. UT-8R-CII-1-4]MDI6022433.1 hypothetical protein [Leucobacter sp. UT-8R-CII-1-4]